MSNVILGCNESALFHKHRIVSPSEGVGRGMCVATQRFFNGTRDAIGYRGQTQRGVCGHPRVVCELWIVPRQRERLRSVLELVRRVYVTVIRPLSAER